MNGYIHNIRETQIKDELQTDCYICQEPLSQSCGQCLHLFCYTCFGCICPNCDLEQSNEEQVGIDAQDAECEPSGSGVEVFVQEESPDIAPPAEKKPKLSQKDGGSEYNEYCSKHIKRALKLYCLTCEQLVCSECLVSGRDHKRHTIDSVSEVYREKFQTTKEKLENTEIYIQEIRQANADKQQIQYRVMKIEQEMLKRLDSISQQAKQEIVSSARQQKQLLVRNSRIPSRKNRALDHLCEKIYTMSQGSFIEEQAKIHQQLDELMNKPLSYYQAAQGDYYDIRCKLLPRIRLVTTSVQIFDHQCSERDALLMPKIPISDYNGNKWELVFNKDEILSVQIITKECNQSGSFLAVIVLLNDDPLKVYQVQLTIPNPASADLLPVIELFKTSKLQSDEYVCPEGRLKLRCGIGPADPTTERIYNKTLIDRQRNEIVSLKKTIRQLSQFVIGTFVVSHLQAIEQSKPVCYLSQKIYDWNMTEWRLNVNSADGFVGAFIHKCNGPKGKYEYFIELLHATQFEQSHKISTVHEFEQGLHGQSKFLPQVKLAAYMRDGFLRFRYGVRAVREFDDAPAEH
ncbi:uncharacterized protein LOC131684972 [Topomyia yanbarensis]|uniref:uncharacterized protein LOC131684972 n=1 Tax=Topomyia yanbarensis TaxID=2498891 RepID=UPI00273C7B9F|nr:uncharacterized protein LOC131684972 [Topomyia yanbarensis]XP_058824263.1 uncharacterized protein LOC131684972 [Topomyia yanbarensis]